MRWKDAQDHCRSKLKPNEKEDVIRFEKPEQLLEDLEQSVQKHTGSFTAQLIKRILPCLQVMQYLSVALFFSMPDQKIEITLLWGILHLIVNVCILNYSQRIDLIGVTRDN